MLVMDGQCFLATTVSPLVSVLLTYLAVPRDKVDPE